MIKPPPTVPECRDPSALAPAFQRRLARVFTCMQHLGFDPMYAETTRSDERQQYLYGFGRDYDDGRGIVTDAPTANTSWHHFGLAADIVSQSQEWDAPGKFWIALGACSRSNGLTWGGDWMRRDKPHVQWGKPMRDTPSPRAAYLLATGGLAAVWKEVGADG